MNKREITTLIRFNFWANARILTACRNLAPEAFAREVNPDPGWGNLRAVLVHALDTEYGWRSVLQAQDSAHILEASDFKDVGNLITRWDLEKEAWFDYLAGLSDEHLNRAYREDSPDGPRVWQIITHVVMHGVQHRSEAALILTGYGHSPGELDFAIFLQENPDSSA